MRRDDRQRPHNEDRKHRNSGHQQTNTLLIDWLDRHRQITSMDTRLIKKTETTSTTWNHLAIDIPTNSHTVTTTTASTAWQLPYAAAGHYPHWEQGPAWFSSASYYGNTFTSAPTFRPLAPTFLQGPGKTTPQLFPAPHSFAQMPREATLPSLSPPVSPRSRK